MNFKELKVLIPDAYGRQVPDILYQLHRLGCHVTTINSSKLDPGYASRYVHVKSVVEGLKDDATIRNEALRRAMTENRFDAVLPITEPVISFLMDHGEEFLGDAKVIAAPFDAFIKAYDKEQTLIACERAGVPCPLTRMDDETVEQYLARAKFPLALKPRKASGSVGFCRVETADELRKMIADGVIKPEEYVIQEFIPQDDIQYVNYVFVDEKGEVKASLVAEKLRWFPVDGGSATLLRATDRKDIVEMSRRLLNEINWRGYCQVGYINDPRDNVPKILEINGRIPASIKLCHLNGINVIQQMIELAFGEEVTPYLENTRIGHSLRYMQTDILWLLKSPKRFKCKPSWFNFIKNHDYIFSWRDPWPFFAYSFRGLIRYNVEMDKRSRTLDKKDGDGKDSADQKDKKSKKK